MIPFIIGAAASVILSEYTKKSRQSKMADGGEVGKKERLDAILERRNEINNYLNKKYGRSRGKNKAEKDEIDALAKEYRKLGDEYLELNGGYNEYAKGGGINKKSNPKVEKFFSLLFESRDVAHKEHLKTESYATHVALNEYYDGVLPLIDGMVESYQGMYGIVNIPEWTPKYENPIKYLKDLLKTIDRDKDKLFTDSSLLNQVDEVKALVQSTLYKLENLK